MPLTVVCSNAGRRRLWRPQALPGPHGGEWESNPPMPCLPPAEQGRLALHGFRIRVNKRVSMIRLVLCFSARTIDPVRRIGRAIAWVVLIAAATGLEAAGGEAPADVKVAAREILDTTGVRGGLVVHLGCGHGKLTAALRASERHVVHGLDTDPAKVERARRHVASLGLYGPVSIARLTGSRLPYADNLVNLLVAEAAGLVPMAEVMRVLCPKGVAYVRAGGRWVKTVKPRPREMDEWTHWLHGPDGNAVAHDQLVGPPRRMSTEIAFTNGHHH